MTITEGTKISELIKANPKSIDIIASINHNFEKLRNPILRKVLAPRVTIRDAARIGGCKVDVFFERLATIGFDIADTPAKISDKKVSSDFFIPENAKINRLDVTSDIERGQDPFLKITATLDQMSTGEYLVLINSFEPAPLIRILEEKFYECTAIAKGKSIYTYILKTNAAKPLQSRKSEISNSFEEKFNEFKDRLKTLDVSSLEMPGPMVTILKELENLPEDAALHVYHRRIPQLLLPELKSQGFQIAIKTCTENAVELLIYK